MLPGVEAATAGRVVERWYRTVGDGCASRASGGRFAPGTVAHGGSRRRVEVVGMPELATALAELSCSEWDVNAVEGDCAVSASADAVVLHAPGKARVGQVRRSAPGARLIATFNGPAPGPLRDEALRAGVDGCVQGTSAAVVASYLDHVSGLAAQPAGHETSDVGRCPG
jgi:hypothetical protein